MRGREERMIIMLLIKVRWREPLTNAGMQQVRRDLKRSRRLEKSDSSGFHPTELFYIHLGQARCKDAPRGLVTRTLLRSKIAELSPAGQSQRVIKEPLCLLYAAGKLGFCACVS